MSAEIDVFVCKLCLDTVIATLETHGNSWQTALINEARDGQSLNLLLTLLHSFSAVELDTTKLNAEEMIPWIPLSLQFRTLLWEKLHSVPWHQTSSIYRTLYGHITALVILGKLQGIVKEDIGTVKDQEKEGDQNLIESVRELIAETDIGLMLGNEYCQGQLNEVMTLLMTIKNDLENERAVNVEGERVTKKPRIDNRKGRSKLPSIPPSSSKVVCSLIHCSEEALDLLDFFDNYFTPQRPVVIRHAVDHWPALTTGSGREWNNLDYLLKGKIEL